MSTRSSLIIGSLALLLGACGGQNYEDDDLDIVDAPVEQSVEQVGVPASVPDASAVQPSVISAESLAIGNVLGTDGAVSAGKPTYATSDTVYASVPVGGYPAGTEVVIYWFGQNGTSIKQDQKKIDPGARFMNFSLSAEDGMTPGRYTAQVDVGETPAGITDFTVQ